jgi:hypothetical protein
LVLAATVGLLGETAAHKAQIPFSRPSHRLAVAEVQHIWLLVQRVAPGVAQVGVGLAQALVRRVKDFLVAHLAATKLAAAAAQAKPVKTLLQQTKDNLAVRVSHQPLPALL